MHISNYEDDKDEWWNVIPYELECKKDIENYEKVNQLHTNYPSIIYNFALAYKQRLKKIKSPKRKANQQ